MIHKRNYRTWMAVVPVVLAITFLAGCAVKTANLWGDPKTGLILQYQTFSPVGEEKDLSGAESIQYEVEPGSIYNIASKFQAVFPDFAGRPVKIGDTWTTRAAITENTNKSESLIKLEVLNTLEGFETVDGMECVRIKAEFTGTIEGKSEPEPGVELVSEGDVKGTDIWYFAYKEGIFVKTVTNGTADVTATATAQGITIPMKRVFQNELKLVK